MFAYTFKRILGMIPTLWLLLTLAFIVIHSAPGGPFSGERALTPEIAASLAQKYHLNASLPQQYLAYLTNLMHGDLGPSLKYQDWTVNQLLATGFPVSLKLGSVAMLIGVIFGIGLGSLAALRKNHGLDYAVMGVALFGISIPTFVTGPVMVLILGVFLRWLPVGGFQEGSVRDWVMPVITLALPQIAVIARMIRASLIEVLQSPYIRTARAKGLSTFYILTRHALRPALLPVISYLGPAMASILTGSVVVEQIFGLPGVGSYLVKGALNRDYTLVLGTVILVGTLMVWFNLLVDLLYAWIDPKIRYESQ